MAPTCLHDGLGKERIFKQDGAKVGQLWKNDIEVAFLGNLPRCATADFVIMRLLWGEEMAF